MDTKLAPISQELARLEKNLIEAYSYIKAASSSELLYIVLPREQAREYLASLKGLYDALQGSGDNRELQLVTDLHDELRIRMIVLRDLLEREIPVPYLERVLTELKVPAKLATAAPSPTRQVGDTRDTRTPARETLLSRLFGWLPLIGGLFRRTPRTPATPQRTTPSAPAAEPQSDMSAPQPSPPLQVMQTMGLHYLMEEDRLKLLESGKELPRVTHGFKLPPILSRFVARDLAEVHFATRAQPKIARTPEELRRKLAEKSQ